MNAVADLEPLRAAAPSASAETVDGLLTVDVAPGEWPDAARAARDLLGCSFLDFLSAVDEGEVVRVVCHVVAPAPFSHLLLRTAVPAAAPAVASLTPLYAGAAWHERETAEMFGVTFLDPTGAPLRLERLLLTDQVTGHPLRKDVLLASRLERPWPGAKEPGESDADADATPSRKRLRPSGVPEEAP